MNNDHFLSEKFYVKFRNSFLRKHHYLSQAEDAALFAFVKFWQKILTTEFETEQEALGYLHKVASNELRRELKTTGFYETLEKLSAEPKAGIDNAMENRDYITQMIPMLSEGNKEILELLRSGWTVKDISEKLALDPDTIRHRIRRIRARFKDRKNF